MLVPPAKTNAQSVDLSGDWQLRGDPALIRAALNRAIRDTDGVNDKIVFERQGNTAPRPGQRSDGRVKGGLVDVFFTDGERLQITQTPSGLFVSFDRAVVEEYRFGENRKIRVGQAEGQRVSGWDGADYLIETLDRSGMKLTERYQLSNDRQTLTRRITFRSKKGETASVIQSFRRR